MSDKKRRRTLEWYDQQKRLLVKESLANMLEGIAFEKLVKCGIIIEAKENENIGEV